MGQKRRSGVDMLGCSLKTWSPVDWMKVCKSEGFIEASGLMKVRLHWPLWWGCWTQLKEFVLLLEINLQSATYLENRFY